MPAAPAAVLDDLPPVPPVRPTIDDCCRGGCEQCVFDLYEDEIDRYDAELKAWEARQIEKSKRTGRAAPKRSSK